MATQNTPEQAHENMQENLLEQRAEVLQSSRDQMAELLRKIEENQALPDRQGLFV